MRLGYYVDLTPALPSVYMPAEEMGVRAMQLFLRILRKERSDGAPIREEFDLRIIAPAAMA